MSELPFAARLAIFLALIAYGVGVCAGALLKARRASKRGDRYVFAWWDGGGFLNRRSMAPRWAVLAMTPTALMAAVLLWGLVTGRWPKPDLLFEIPQGWLDVSEGSPESSYERLPTDIRESVRAAAPRVKVFAIDVDHPGKRPGSFSTFAAGYVHGSGEVSEATVRELVRRSQSLGGVPPVQREAIEIRSVDGVRLGRAVVDLDDSGLRMYFYAFAVGRTFAQLYCTEPFGMTPSVEQLCDAAAESTARRNSR